MRRIPRAVYGRFGLVPGGLGNETCLDRGCVRGYLTNNVETAASP